MLDTSQRIRTTLRLSLATVVMTEPLAHDPAANKLIALAQRFHQQYKRRERAKYKSRILRFGPLLALDENSKCGDIKQLNPTKFGLEWPTTHEEVMRLLRLAVKDDTKQKYDRWAYEFVALEHQYVQTVNRSQLV
jgi:hypothetical protein